MPFSQDLTGLIEPNAKTWLDATPEQRLWYYQQVAKLAERRKRVELMQAIGRGPGGRSVVMDPRKHPRSDGANGPVMDPHGGLSRAYRLLASSATAGSCKLYWRAGGAIVSKSGVIYFTDVLGYHADGKVRGAPIRDVRLPDDSIADLQRQGEGIWRKRPKQSGATPPKSSATQPTKLSKTGPTQVSGNPFRTILPPKTPKVSRVSRAKAAADARKAEEAARVAEAARRKAEAEARAKAKPVAPPKPRPVTPPPPPPPKPKTGIERAIELATEAGIRIDPEGHDLLLKHNDEFTLSRIPAVFYGEKGQPRILINEKYAGWSDIAAMMAEANGKNWFSTGHPDHIIQHEIGHALHYDTVGHDAFAEAMGGQFDAARRKQVFLGVSTYATTNPGELVAEVYAGRVAGREFSPEVMALYRSFGGPG